MILLLIYSNRNGRMISS